MSVRTALDARESRAPMPPAHDPSKPVGQLWTLASALGWRGLDMWQHASGGDVVTWYTTSDRKFFIQINEHPPGQTNTYAACVYADRYGICTGWHTFTLADTDAVDFLLPWLRRRAFKDRNWRRDFCRRHPECCFTTPTPARCAAQRRRGNWPPYFPNDPKPAP